MTSVTAQGSETSAPSLATMDKCTTVEMTTTGLRMSPSIVNVMKDPSVSMETPAMTLGDDSETSSTTELSIVLKVTWSASGSLAVSRIFRYTENRPITGETLSTTDDTGQFSMVGGELGARTPEPLPDPVPDSPGLRAVKIYICGKHFCMC